MRFFLCVLSLILIAGCGSSRKIKTGAAGIGNDSLSVAGMRLQKEAASLFEEESTIPFKTFSAKVKVEYEDQYGKQPETNAYVRMQKDSFIWVSITATFLNIEAARVWMTADSIVIVNKLEKTIESHPLDFIREKVALPLRFQDIQNLIAGKLILKGDSIQSVSATENFLRIFTTLTNLKTEIFFSRLRQAGGPAFLLARQSIEVEGPWETYGAEVLYEDYEKSDQGYFSTAREINIPSKKQRISLVFRQYEFNNELSVPFSRPEGYTIK